jgi:hypothetical protein
MKVLGLFALLLAPALLPPLSGCIDINPPDPSGRTWSPPRDDASAGPAVRPPQEAAARPPLEFHIQLSVQEQLPRAKGLGATIRYPQPGSDLPIYTGKVAIVYEWRPKDGLEERTNPRTGKDYGPIWKDTIAEQMQPDNLQRHLNSVDRWIGTFVPANFEGTVVLDVERWPLKSDTFHLGAHAKQQLDKLAPGKKQAELMSEFMRITEARARAVRPRVKAWGWWSMGEMHPAFPIWHKDKYKAWRETDLPVERQALEGTWIPFPSFYFPTSFSKANERAAAWPLITEHWTLLYGQERLARDGYAYLNIRHPYNASKEFATKPLTREQFRECVEAAWSVGIRRFVIWDSIDKPEVRDIAQRFIDEILVPEVRLCVERYRAER